MAAAAQRRIIASASIGRQKGIAFHDKVIASTKPDAPMRRYVPIAIPALVVLTGAFLMSCASRPGERTEIEREEIAVVGDYRFVTEQTVIYEDGVEYDNIYKSPMRLETILVIYKGEQEIHREEGWRIEIEDRHPKPGTDVTGDGSPDVIITDYSGGAHCCFTYYIFELREPLNIISIYTGDGSFSFDELDGRPGLEVVTTDDFYTEWINGYVGAPFPHFMWRYNGSTYEPDPDLTRQQPLKEAEFQRLVQQVRDGEWPASESYLPREFLSVTLELIYGGNLVQALDFIQATWPAQKPGQAEFVAELLQCRMRDNAIWPMLAEMNGLPVEKARSDCRDREIGEHKPWAIPAAKDDG